VSSEAADRLLNRELSFVDVCGRVLELASVLAGPYSSSA